MRTRAASPSDASASGPTSSARRRAPIITGAVLGAAALVAAIAIPLTANASVDLPDKNAEELIQFAHDADVEALSGTIEQRSELGLPDLGGMIPGGAPGAGSGGEGAADFSDAVELLTGSHTAKVYVDGERARLQVLDRLGERNVYVDGAAASAWFVDSSTQTATRFSVTGDRDAFGDELRSRLDEKRDALQQNLEQRGESLPTPGRMLSDALVQLDASTEVTVGDDARVAGRDAYELILRPRTADTLVGEVRFAIDGETGAALSASVSARGGEEPVFRVGYTDVAFTAPDASTLEYVPADGYTVVERESALPSASDLDEWMQRHGDENGPGARVYPPPTIHGEGWSTVVELPPGAGVVPGPAVDSEPGYGGEGLGDAAAILAQVTRGVEGGRVLETALVTVMFADDGRVLAGAVPAERLVAVASGNG